MNFTNANTLSPNQSEVTTDAVTTTENLTVEKSSRYLKCPLHNIQQKVLL